MPTPAPPLGTVTGVVAELPDEFGVDDPPQVTSWKPGGAVAVMV
jgi:hypothetical protein